MRVRVDQVANRLVRDGFLDLGDDRLGALLVLRPFDDHDVVALVDGDAVMRAARQVIDAVRELLDIHLHRRRREVPHLVRYGDVDGRVRLDLRDGDIQYRIPALGPNDVRGE